MRSEAGRQVFVSKYYGYLYWQDGNLMSIEFFIYSYSQELLLTGLSMKPEDNSSSLLLCLHCCRRVPFDSASLFS